MFPDYIKPKIVISDEKFYDEKLTELSDEEYDDLIMLSSAEF